MYLSTVEGISVNVPNVAVAPCLSQPNKLAARAEDTWECYILAGNLHWTESSLQPLPYHLSTIPELLNDVSS